MRSSPGVSIGEPAAGDPAAPTTDPKPAPSIDLVAVVAALAAAPTADEGIGLRRVPATALDALAELERTLPEILQAALIEQASLQSPLLQRSLLRALASAGLPKRSKPEHWGDLLGVEVERPAHPSQAVIVLVRLWVPCGEQTLLYAFRLAAGRLKLTLSASPFGRFTDAGNHLAYHLLSRSVEEPLTLALVSDASSCVNFWRRLSLRVVRQSDVPASPYEVFERTYRYQALDGFSFEADRERFALSFRGDDRFWPWFVTTRQRLERYALTEGGAIERQSPLSGDEAWGFVFDWLDLSEADAARWLCTNSPPGSADGLSLLQQRARLQRDLGGLTMGPPDVLACESRQSDCEVVELSLRLESAAKDLVRLKLERREGDRCVAVIESVVQEGTP